MLYKTDNKGRKSRNSTKSNQLISNLTQTNNGFYKSMIEGNSDNIEDTRIHKKFKLPLNNKTWEIGFRSVPSWFMTWDPMKIKRDVLVVTDIVNQAKAGSSSFKSPMHTKIKINPSPALGTYKVEDKFATTMNTTKQFKISESK